MCGILGRIIGRGRKSNQTQFEDALNLMKHRGPDDFGIYQDESVELGHRRLSIIDLTKSANQPFKSDDEKILLVFNGEIYNYAEIREDLKKNGYTFRTNSDTEVLLKLYQKEGIAFVDKLIGMFAIGIYDKKINTSYLIRDRLGIKPLFYFQNKSDGSLTFASEAKSIIKLENNVVFTKNVNALSSYLSFRYPILDDTYFQEINCVKAGHILTVRNGEITESRYWNPSAMFQQQDEERPESYYLEKIKELLDSSVKYRMISDVPVGAFLSGGVDSSVVTALMALSSESQVKTFTIGFEEEGYNEFSFSDIIAKRYNTDHQEIMLSGSDYIDSMKELISFKDAPLSVPNEVPLSKMSKELKKKVTVVLSGEGADEIFGGYGRIFRSAYDYKRSQNSFKNKLDQGDRDLLNREFDRLYGRNEFSEKYDHFYQLYSYMPRAKKENLLLPEFQNENIEAKFKNRFLSYFEEIKGDNYTNQIMYAFEQIHLKGLLGRVDNATMYASVEARVPFVDHRLVEFAFSIPTKYKLKWNSEIQKAKSKLVMSDKISENLDTPKYILKKAYEGIIDKEVLYRKKMGFPVPLNNWFGGKFNDFAKEILLDKKTIERGEINAKQVEKYLSDNSLKNNHKDAMHIWMLLNNEFFNRIYF